MHLFVKEGYHDIIYIGTKLNGSRAKAYAGCFRYCNKYQIRHFDFIFNYERKGLKCIDIGGFGADLSKRIADICHAYNSYLVYNEIEHGDNDLLDQCLRECFNDTDCLIPVLH